ncbi:cytochrome oxidase small assembly protein [Polynucleobacter sp. MWH-Braz-FAM2G]|uniref:cytochrome oxidase small assembly protein n=1 Tax=Polynucleobacter sp. MWH-Braz-FAM2G TaxID=1855883 RepID=UPI001BFE639E|nr:cytochrome oxidase small assembly protein [Polynucleobacter sp. MWH-Braz-FAM2G]
MVQKVWSGLFHHQLRTIHLRLRLVQSKCVKQEFNSSHKQALTANNRRLGFVLLSIVLVFFIGIMIKRSVLG